MRRRRGRDAALLGLGAAGFALSAALADDRVCPAEEALFRAANELPLPYRAVWVPMQYGTFGTVFALAGLAAWRRQQRLAIGLLLGGTSSYVLAKAAKKRTGRGRPAAELEHVTVRGKEAGDLGFPSGHASVSAALTTAAAPFVPPRVRLLAAGLAGFVSFARVHIGAHLPLDGVGGACMGVALSAAVNLALGVEESSASIGQRMRRRCLL
jgi:membrane-associated phospholipid phosphatase